MQTTTVFLVLVLLTVISFFMGRKRSHAVTAGQGGAQGAALAAQALRLYGRACGHCCPPCWCWCCGWYSRPASWLELVVAELPDSVQADVCKPAWASITTRSSALPGALLMPSSWTQTQIAAAEHYQALVASSGTIKALLVFLVAMVGALLALRRIHLRCAPATMSRTYSSGSCSAARSWRWSPPSA